MGEYSFGSRIKFIERVGRFIDDRVETSRAIRLKTEEAVVKITPTWEHRNLEGGTLIGAILAGLTTTSSGTAAPIGNDTEIVDSEVLDDGVKYKVNVDSGFRNQARFKALMESGTGFTSIITDRFDVNEKDALKERVARDTWQYEVIVYDDYDKQIS